MQWELILICINSTRRFSFKHLNGRVSNTSLHTTTLDILVQKWSKQSEREREREGESERERERERERNKQAARQFRLNGLFYKHCPHYREAVLIKWIILQALST